MRLLKIKLYLDTEVKKNIKDKYSDNADLKNCIQFDKECELLTSAISKVKAVDKVVSTRTNSILSTIAIMGKLYPNDKILKNYINKVSVDVFKIIEL